MLRTAWLCALVVLSPSCTGPKDASPTREDTASAPTDDTWPRTDDTEDPGPGCVDTTVYPDLDQDAWGDGRAATTACLAEGEAPPEGFVLQDGDCDDGAAAVYPGAPEDCDELDNDCDGAVDEEAPVWYSDADADGQGDPDTPTVACEAPGGAVADDRDCDDGDVTVYAGAPELCGDGRVNDCEGSVAASVAACPYEDATAFSALDTVLLGAGSSDATGAAVALVGDVDGDGRADLLLSASRDDTAGTDAGAAVLFTGAPAGTLSVSAATARLLGEGSADYAGFAVAGAGDADGDGYDDLLVGAYGDDTDGLDGGAGYLVAGPVTGALSLASATAKRWGEASFDRSGCAVSGAGDVDGDGLDDLLIGAYQADTGASNAGAVYLISGLVTGGAALSEAAGLLYDDGLASEVGAALSGGADIDGDGQPDQLVAGWGEGTNGVYAGAVWLVTGPVSGAFHLDDATAKLLGGAAGDYAGGAVDARGDVDGDGYGDVLVGAYRESTAASKAGAAYLFYGPVTGVQPLANADAIWYGAAASDALGVSVAHAGDLDGSGQRAVAIGADGADDPEKDAGALQVYSGAPSGALSTADAAFWVLGDATLDFAGGAADGGADVDGDGLDDLLLSARGSDVGASNAGAAAVWTTHLGY